MTSLPDRLRERILVLRCQAGDEAAFEEIVSAFGPGLRYYVYKLLGRPEGAEDTVQEVWLDVYRGIAQLQHPEAFRTWLYRIARARAFRALRKERPQPQLIDDTDLIATEAEDGEFSEEDAKRIHLALDRLSAEHREVLLLRFIQDLPYEEIAQVTGSHLGTVKSRIHFAKRLLRKEMERMSDHE
jgi:RNA polymerase sigma-70 factor (ECF subfamily)